jgi:hypothetical protein
MAEMTSTTSRWTHGHAVEVARANGRHELELAAKSRLPAMYAAREFVEDGAS